MEATLVKLITALHSKNISFREKIETIPYKIASLTKIYTKIELTLNIFKCFLIKLLQR